VIEVFIGFPLLPVRGVSPRFPTTVTGPKGLAKGEPSPLGNPPHQSAAPGTHCPMPSLT